MKLMELPLWAWIVFYVLVLLMLVADLKMFGKKGQHEVNRCTCAVHAALILRDYYLDEPD